MAMDAGGYLRRRAGISSGKEVRKPASSALMRVDKAGEPNAVCMKSIRCAIVAYGVEFIAYALKRNIIAAYACRLDWCGGWVFGRFILQSGEDGDLDPLRIMV